MRWGFALAALCAAVVLAACGEEEQQFSDAKVAAALHLEQRGARYTVGSNPFCTVQEILNDAEETSALTKRQRQVAITSKQGDIGVLVVTPFAPSCRRQVFDELNRLDRKPKG